MAEFAFDFPAEFNRQLDQAANTNRILKAMVNAGVPVLEKYVKKAMHAHRSTGAMEDSVKYTKAKSYKNGSGYYAVVRPTGRDDKTGVRNMEKLAHIEYGTSHQPGTPILSAALEAAQEETVAAMQNAYTREVLKR